MYNKQHLWFYEYYADEVQIRGCLNIYPLTVNFKFPEIKRIIKT